MSYKRRYKIAILTVIAILFLTLDRLLKSLALAGYFDKSIPLLGNFFSLQFAKNYFIAFSLPVVQGVALNGIITIIILGLIYYLVFLCKRKAAPVKIFFVLLVILGGASNLADRINWSFVIDYWDLKYFTVFNLADTMITVGVLGLILFNLIASHRHNNSL